MFHLTMALLQSILWVVHAEPEKPEPEKRCPWLHENRSPISVNEEKEARDYCKRHSKPCDYLKYKCMDGTLCSEQKGCASRYGIRLCPNQAPVLCKAPECVSISDRDTCCMPTSDKCRALGKGASLRTDCPFDCTSVGINEECPHKCTQGTVVDETNHGECEAERGIVGQCFFSYCVDPVKCTTVYDCLQKQMRTIKNYTQ